MHYVSQINTVASLVQTPLKDGGCVYYRALDEVHCNTVH